MKKIFTLLLIALSFNSFGQKLTSCGFKVPPSLPFSNFQSVYEAREVINSMLTAIKWQENFLIQEMPGENNAYATMQGNRRYIIYDNDFLERLDYYGRTKNASISVLAHEMGHHYNNHVLDGQGSTPPKELEADYFSGYVMAKLGASLNDSKAAMEALADEKGGSTHPPKSQRLVAITNGWNYAKGLTGTTPTQPKTPTPAPTPKPTPTPVPMPTPAPTPSNLPPTGNGGEVNTEDGTWINLINVYKNPISIELSDDGKSYQKAEVKPQEPFVFKYEIYNYGWARVRYGRSYKIFKLIHGKNYTLLYNSQYKAWFVVEVEQPDNFNASPSFR